MKREEWQAAFGAPSASFDARFQQTLNHLEEEKKMKRFTLRTAILVLALLLATMGVVYAATNSKTLADFILGRGNAHLPEDFATGYDQDFTQEVGDVRFHIRDAYVNGNTLYAIIEASLTDGSPALFLPQDAEPDDLIGNLYRELLEDPRTIAEYAREKSLPLYWVDSWFKRNGEIMEGTFDIAMEEDLRGALFAEVFDIQPQGGFAVLTWNVMTWKDVQEIQQADKEIKLPVEESKTWEVPVHQRIEGSGITVDTIYFRQNRMDLQADVTYHIDQASDWHADDHYFFEFLDPATGELIPGGAGGSSTIASTNEEDTAFIHKFITLSADFTGDTVLLRAENPFSEEGPAGTIQVKIR